MEPWQERVIVERDELADKLIKLSVFISGNAKFLALDNEDKRLMRAQRGAMLAYHDALEDRIRRWV
jgi:uncharacterized protein